MTTMQDKLLDGLEEELDIANSMNSRKWRSTRDAVEAEKYLTRRLEGINFLVEWQRNRENKRHTVAKWFNCRSINDHTMPPLQSPYENADAEFDIRLSIGELGTRISLEHNELFTKIARIMHDVERNDKEPDKAFDEINELVKQLELKVVKSANVVRKKVDYFIEKKIRECSEDFITPYLLHTSDGYHALIDEFLPQEEVICKNFVALCHERLMAKVGSIS